jgi:hypothetical protein
MPWVARAMRIAVARMTKLSASPVQRRPEIDPSDIDQHSIQTKGRYLEEGWRDSGCAMRITEWVATMAVAHLQASGQPSFDPHMCAFLSHRALHNQDHRQENEHHNGQHPKHIEISKGGCLLLTQVLECLQSELLRSHGIAGLLKELPLSLIEEGICSRIEGIERFNQPETVELVAALLKCLRQRRTYAASLVAQQAQQTDSRSAQLYWNVEIGRYIRRGKAYRKAHD